MAKRKKNKEAAEDLALARESEQGGKLAVWIFLGVSILMLVVFFVSAVINAARLTGEKTVVGTVVGMTQRTSYEGNPYYYPVIEFDLPDGSTQRVQTDVGDWPAAYVLGQPVKVRYQPAQPQKAYIESTTSLVFDWIVPGVTGLLGGIFFFVSLMVRWLMKVKVGPDDHTPASEAS